MSTPKDIVGKIQGTIVNFRTGPKTQRPKECIIRFPDVRSANEAARLIGRKVAWFAGKSMVRGKITALHGRNGLVRARFRKGLPGQLGVRVEIMG